MPYLARMRCWFFIIVFVFAICLTPQPSFAQQEVPVDLAKRQDGHDWPDFLGPNRNGTSAEIGLNFNWPKSGPALVWQVPLGTSYDAPSVSRGRLFHFDRHDDEDVLHCRLAETGKLLWSIRHPTQYEDLLGYNNGPRCSPVVDGPRVYTFNAEGILQCVRIEDGQRLWQIDTAKIFGVVKNFFGVGSTPIIYEDLLIANIGGSPEGSSADVYAANGMVAGNGTGVVAFDKYTGEVHWKATDELASYASPILSDIDGQAWCFVFARGGLVGLDPRTGAVRFQYPWRAKSLESVNASTPVAAGHEIFISETYGKGSSLLRVKSAGYDVVWSDEKRGRDKAMMLHWNTPIFHDGFLYGSSGRHTHSAELRCVEWATGEIKWSERGLGRCSLLYVDGHLICQPEDGSLMVIKATPEKYDLVCSAELNDADGAPLLKPPTWSAPVLARGLLYLRGSDRLVCLDMVGSE